MKVVIYKNEDMEMVANLLNKISVTGIEQAKIVAAISCLLENGEIKNISDRKEVKKDDPD